MKTYLLLGYGSSSEAVYAYLKKRKVRIIIFEEKKKIEGMDFYSFKRLKEEKPKVDIAIRSPGISSLSEVYLFTKTLARRTISEIEFAYSILKKKHPHFIFITGTNGKSTAVSMVHAVLKSQYPSSFVAGNIGIPLSSFLEKKVDKNTFFVVELSSFQLEDSYSLRGDYAILTNLSYNHLDEVKDYDFYVASKKRIAYFTKKNHFLCYEEIKEMEDLSPIILSSFTSFFPSFCLDGFVGEHNRRHALLSFYIAYQYQIPFAKAKKQLENLLPLPYRNQKEKVKGKWIVINDSKSTNVASTEQCLFTFQDRKRILILGGIAKSGSFGGLSLKEEDEIYIYGRDRYTIYHDLKRGMIKETLKEVIAAIQKYKEEEVYILFSPACSSYDQFDNYLARGSYFHRMMEEKGNEGN